MARLPWALVWALSAQAILSLTRLFSKMVVGGRFGPGSEAELGYYDTAFGILMMVVALHEAFVTTPMTYFTHRVKVPEQRTFAGRMLSLSLAYCVLAAIGLGVALLARAFMKNFESIGPLMIALTALTVMMPFQLLREFSRRWLLATLQVWQSAVLELLFATLFIVFLLVMLAMETVSASTLFLYTGIANLACLVIWWKYFRTSFDPIVDGLATQTRKNFTYGKWIAGENLSSVGMIFFSQWFLMATQGEVAAGVYSACMTIVLMSNPFLLGVASLFAPQAAQEYENNGYRGLLAMLAKYTVLVTLVLGTFSAVLFFYGDFLTAKMFGESYRQFFLEHFQGRNDVTFILSLAMPCFGISFLLTNCLLATNRPQHNFTAAMLGMLVTIACNVLATSPNVKTAAYSFLAGVIVTTLARGVLLFMTWVKREQTESR